MHTRPQEARGSRAVSNWLVTTLARSDALSAPWYPAFAAAPHGWWAGVWAALLNGASLVVTSPTIVLPDTIHFGSLISGGFAAYTTWRVLRMPAVGVGVATPAPIQASSVPHEHLAG